MNARLPLVAVSVLILAVGCKTFDQRSAADYEPGQSPKTKFANDSEACARQSEVDQRRFGVGGEIDLTHATFNRMYDACMRASGYKRKPEKE